MNTTATRHSPHHKLTYHHHRERHHHTSHTSCSSLVGGMNSNKNCHVKSSTPSSSSASSWTKYAILFSYTGTYFYGLQLQARLLAIQNVLWEAMKNLKCAKKFSELGMHFASRTDRGVHAMRNIMVTKVYPRVIDNVCHGDLHVFCEKLESEIKSVLSRHPILPGRVVSSSDPERFIWIHEMRPVGDSFCAINDCKARKYLFLLSKNLVTTKKSRQEWTDDQIVEQLNRLFHKFEGNHSFHNYAGGEVRTSYHRSLYYVGLDRDEPVQTIHGETFFILRLYGEGFMKHHIRSIIGIVSAVMCQKLDEKCIEESLEHGTEMTVPEVEGANLILEEQEFDNPAVVNWSDTTEERIREFKKIIYQEIVRYGKERESLLKRSSSP